MNRIIERLTQCSWLRREQLYSSPFKDEFSIGANTFFLDNKAIQANVSTLVAIHRNAADGF